MNDKENKDVFHLSSDNFMLINIFTRFIVAVVDSGIAWTPTMVEAYEDFMDRAKVTGPRPLTKYYQCPYCDKRFNNSYNGTGSDIPCCGEVGHVGIFYELTRQNP